MSDATLAPTTSSMDKHPNHHVIVDNSLKPVVVVGPDTPSTGMANGAAAGPLIGNQTVRTRITVVCAECKRLKLKCDRRTPCGSCVKRETVSRCVYSAAAAEKIDVQSLHNRLLQVETQLTVLNSTPGFVKGSATKEERALFDVATSSSSLSISLQDVAEIWLSQLDLNSDNGEPLAGIPTLEPAVLPDEGIGSSIFDLMNNNMRLFKVPPGRRRNSMKGGIPAGVTPDLVKQLPAEPLRSVLLSHLESTFFMHPCVNFKWFKSRIEDMFTWAQTADIDNSNDEDAPSLSFFACAAAGFAIGAQCLQEFNELNGQVPPLSTGKNAKAKGSSRGSTAARSSPPGSKSNSPKQSNTPPKSVSPPRKSVSPKGAKDAKDSQPPAVRARSISGQGFNIGSPRPEAHSLYALSTISLNLWTQRYGYAGYDLDYVHAHLLRILYLLYASGRPEVAHELFPLMGHLVNTARMMSLNIDPDDGAERTGGISDGSGEPLKADDGEGKYSLFEKETRRRLWWHIYYYDLFVSDTMGQSPLIVDDEMQQTTRLPTDVDEEVFGPHSMSLPSPRDDDPTGNLAYFIQQCRLAQLVKGIRRRCNPSNGLCPSIDEAVSYETEINQWVAELPERFRMDVNLDMPPSVSKLSPVSVQPPNAITSPSERASNEVYSLSPTPAPSTYEESPYHIAQRCEIAIITNRILLKVFMPFLKNAVTMTGSVIKAPTQSVLSTVNAAHAIVQSSRVLRTVWAKTRPATHVFYCFARTLFDAALITANNALTQPQTIFSRIALEDVALAVQVLKDPVVAATGRGPVYGPPDGSPNAASKILEVLQNKAVKARGLPPAPNNSGTKRKLADMDLNPTTGASPGTGPAALAAASRPAFQVNAKSSNESLAEQAKSTQTQVQQGSSTPPNVVQNGQSDGSGPSKNHGSSSHRKSTNRSGVSSHATAPPKTKYGNAPWSSAVGVDLASGSHTHSHGNHHGHRSEKERKPQFSIRVRDEQGRSNAAVRQRTNSTLSRPVLTPALTTAHPPASQTHTSSQQPQHSMVASGIPAPAPAYAAPPMPPPRNSPTTMLPPRNSPTMMLPARTSPSGSSQSQDTPPSGGYTVGGYLDDGYGGVHVNFDAMFGQQPQQVHHQSQPQQAHHQPQVHQQAQVQQRQHQHQHQPHSQPSPPQQTQNMYSHNQYGNALDGMPQQSQQQPYFGSSNSVPFPSSYVQMHPPMNIPNNASIDPSGVLVMAPQASMSMPGTPQEHRQSFSSDGSNPYYGAGPMENKQLPQSQSLSQESLVNVGVNSYGQPEQNKSQSHLVDVGNAGQPSNWPDPAYQAQQMGQPPQQWDGYTYYKS